MGNTNQNTTTNQDSVEVFNPYPYDNSVEILAKLRLDLLKECLEMTGVDFGKTNNKIDLLSNRQRIQKHFPRCRIWWW